MYAITNPRREGNAYADLSQRLPYLSARGNEYILVAYHYESNAILIEYHLEIDMTSPLQQSEENQVGLQ